MPPETESLPSQDQEPAMDWLHDSRTDCISVLTTLSTGRYLELVKHVHNQRGAITGQRDVLKTTTAKRIRDRMISDIRAGAVLPPVVIGVLVDPATHGQYSSRGKWSQTEFLESLSKGSLSIIDGMQRTAALLDAEHIDSSVLPRGLRVEFWVAENVRALVYRMLVLNTGQVPWTLARQLSVVYQPLLIEITKNVPEIERMFTPDKPGRRVNAGEFSSDALVELYLAFSLRKTNVDPRESLSEEFSRLDFVDNLSDNNFQGYFYTALSSMIGLDLSFERYEDKTSRRFSRGREIFGSQPARIGFIVAVAQYVLGRPGLDRATDEREPRMVSIRDGCLQLIADLNQLGDAELGGFLRLDVLSEVLDKKVGQVGRYERSIFNEAFKVLIEEKFRVPSLLPCWRAS